MGHEQNSTDEELAQQYCSTLKKSVPYTGKSVLKIGSRTVLLKKVKRKDSSKPLVTFIVTSYLPSRCIAETKSFFAYFSTIQVTGVPLGTTKESPALYTWVGPSFSSMVTLPSTM